MSIGSVNSDTIIDASIQTVDISTGAINTDTIRDQAVTTPKIADGQVVNSKLSSNSVSVSKLQNHSITTEKLADGAVTFSKFDPSLSIIKNIQFIDANAQIFMHPGFGNYSWETSLDMINPVKSNVFFFEHSKPDFCDFLGYEFLTNSTMKFSYNCFKRSGIGWENFTVRLSITEKL